MDFSKLINVLTDIFICLKVGKVLWYGVMKTNDSISFGKHLEKRLTKRALQKHSIKTLSERMGY
jgi:hypothetical protein